MELQVAGVMPTRSGKEEGYRRHQELQLGLPYFSWYMTPKTGKNVPNEHIM
jgi:Ethanolamine utilization protein EutJ (predicted chaperonin)